MLSKAVFLVAIGFLCVSALPRQRANEVVEEQLTNQERDKLDKCLNDNGIERVLNGDDRGRIDMEKVTQITKKCFQEIPELRPLVLTINTVEYLAQPSKKDFCGIDLKNSSNSELNKMAQKFEDALSNQRKEFCALTFEDTLPALCKLRNVCKKGHQEDLDALFSTFYSIQQVIRKHPQAFTCKDKSGKDLLGKIINEKAYTDGFDVRKDQFLTRQLPCGVKFNSTSTPTKSPSQKTGSIGKKAMAFVNHQISKRLF